MDAAQQLVAGLLRITVTTDLEVIADDVVGVLTDDLMMPAAEIDLS